MLVKKGIELSIIIPVYNEQDNIAVLSQEIINCLNTNFCFEIIFIDDGSKDETVSRIQEQMQADKRVKLVRHSRNFGQSIALVSGAKAAQYPFLVTLDGDGQNDPADIPRLSEFLHNNKTVVLGTRNKRHDNWLRRVSSRVANKVRQYVLNDECIDSNCGLKIFPRDVFLQLPLFNHVHRFLPALFLRAGMDVIHVPVNHRHRIHGVSKYGVFNRLFVGLYDLIGVRWLMKRPCVAEITQHES